MSDYINDMSGSYVDPDNSYSTLDKYNLITNMKFVNQKHIPASNFPTLPKISTEQDVSVLTYNTTEPYPIVDKAYGSSCLPQSYYVGKCPTNQFVKDLSNFQNVKPTPTPKSKQLKNMPLLIEVVIEEGLKGVMYRVNTSSLPASIQDLFKQHTKTNDLTNPIYVKKSKSSKSGGADVYQFFEQVNGKGKLRKLKVKLPTVQFVSKSPKKPIGKTGFEEGGIMKYAINSHGHKSSNEGTSVESMQTPPTQMKFPSQQPMKSPMQTPPMMKSPTQTPPMKSPMQTPPMKFPTQTPSMKSPMQTPPMKFPTQTPPMKSPMQTPPMKFPTQTPSMKSPMMKSQTNSNGASMKSPMMKSQTQNFNSMSS
jgi:hypothetical protein